ncbi:MAG: hypothetical protein ACE5EC_09470 [Phycisphaerae bacterium]
MLTTSGLCSSSSRSFRQITSEA